MLRRSIQQHAHHDFAGALDTEALDTDCYPAQLDGMQYVESQLFNFRVMCKLTVPSVIAITQPAMSLTVMGAIDKAFALCDMMLRQRLGAFTIYSDWARKSRLSAVVRAKVPAAKVWRGNSRNDERC